MFRIICQRVNQRHSPRINNRGFSDRNVTRILNGDGVGDHITDAGDTVCPKVKNAVFCDRKFRVFGWARCDFDAGIVNCTRAGVNRQSSHGSRVRHRAKVDVTLLHSVFKNTGRIYIVRQHHPNGTNATNDTVRHFNIINRRIPRVGDSHAIAQPIANVFKSWIRIRIRDQFLEDGQFGQSSFDRVRRIVLNWRERCAKRIICCDRRCIDEHSRGRITNGLRVDIILGDCVVTRTRQCFSRRERDGRRTWRTRQRPQKWIRDRNVADCLVTRIGRNNCIRDRIPDDRSSCCAQVNELV